MTESKDSPQFEHIFSNLLENNRATPLIGSQAEQKIFPCAHRRRHLAKTSRGLELRFFCKDSKIIYRLNRKIKVTPISMFDCLRCEVPEAENRINCRELGFEKMVQPGGQLTTRFYCGREKNILLHPVSECARCRNIKYFA